MNLQQCRIANLGLIAVVFLAAASLCGCKNNDSKVIGRWTLPIGDQSATIHFKADRTFSEEGTGALRIAGKWSFSETTVTLKIETVGGQPAELVQRQLINVFSKPLPGMKKPDPAKLKASLTSISLKISEDGDTMTRQQSTESSSLTLTKQG